MTRQPPELAWRRRKREAAERAAADRRLRESHRAIVIGAMIAASRTPYINNRPADSDPERELFVEAMLEEIRGK